MCGDGYLRFGSHALLAPSLIYKCQYRDCPFSRFPAICGLHTSNSQRLQVLTPSWYGVVLNAPQSLTLHFLPFFFFFPPVPAPAFASGAVPPILTSPLSSTCGVAAPSPPAGMLKSSVVSGSAAICLPSLPRFPISLPTSAPLLVSYCRHVPDSGSYVFSVKVAVTSSTSCDCGCGDESRALSAGRDAFFSSYFCRFLILVAVGLWTEYLEVMRVVVGRAFSSSDDCSYHSALVAKYGIVTVTGWLEQLQGGGRLGQLRYAGNFWRGCARANVGLDSQPPTYEGRRRLLTMAEQGAPRQL